MNMKILKKIIINLLQLSSPDMAIGPGLILLNKYILDELSFPFPIFLSGLGVFTSALAARVIIALGYVTVERKEAVVGHLWYRRVLPVGLAHALSLSTGNAVYLLLNVGLIQMLKSFTPVIVMAFLFLAGVERPTRCAADPCLPPLRQQALLQAYHASCHVAPSSPPHPHTGCSASTSHRLNICILLATPSHAIS